MPFIEKKRLGDSPAGAVANIGGLMGPIGALGMAAKLTDDDLAQLHELLGKPIQLGKRVLMLSSGNPAKDEAILHDGTTGERIKTALSDFLNMFKQHGEEIDAPSVPDVSGSVLSQPGQKVENVGKLGPKGGFARKKL